MVQRSEGSPRLMCRSVNELARAWVQIASAYLVSMAAPGAGAAGGWPLTPGSPLGRNNVGRLTAQRHRAAGDEGPSGSASGARSRSVADLGEHARSRASREPGLLATRCAIYAPRRHRSARPPAITARASRTSATQRAASAAARARWRTGELGPVDPGRHRARCACRLTSRDALALHLDRHQRHRSALAPVPADGDDRSAAAPVIADRGPAYRTAAVSRCTGVGEPVTVEVDSREADPPRTAYPQPVPERVLGRDQPSRACALGDNGVLLADQLAQGLGVRSWP